MVSLSDSTFSMGNPVNFVHAADLEDVLSSFGTHSYLLVDARPGVESADLARRIERAVDKVHAMPQEAFIESDFQNAMQMGVEINAIMSAICTVLAMLIIAFTAYSSVARKRRGYHQSAGCTESSTVHGRSVSGGSDHGAGYLIALAVAWFVLPHVSLVAPMVTLVVTFEAVTRVGLTAQATALIAALAPAYYVGRLDPAFKV